MALHYQPLNYSNAVFACVNSGFGFRSYFDAFLDQLQYLYIIKGGPGTGKSSLMRAVATEGEKRGLQVLKIYCSSDPSSLDGVLLPELSLGLVDGTSPHVTEPTLPGAKEQIINPGDYWDSQILISHLPDIKELTAKKSDAYQTAFLLFAAAQKVNKASETALLPYLDLNKMENAARKLLSKEDLKEGTPRIFPQKALSMDGAVELDGNIRTARRVLTVLPCFGAEKQFLSCLYRLSSHKNCLVSPDPLTLLPDSILFPETGLLVRCGEKTELAKEKILSAGKFLSLPKESKISLKNYEKETERLINMGLSQLSTLSSYHFALEKIYGSAMHFEGMELLRKDLIARIFGDLPPQK